MGRKRGRIGGWTLSSVRRSISDQSVSDGWLGVGVSSVVHGTYYPSLFCFVVSFPEVEHNWFVDRFYLQLGSGYDVGFVRT